MQWHTSMPGLTSMLLASQESQDANLATASLVRLPIVTVSGLEVFDDIVHRLSRVLRDLDDSGVLRLEQTSSQMVFLLVSSIIKRMF